MVFLLCFALRFFAKNKNKVIKKKPHMWAPLLSKTWMAGAYLLLEYVKDKWHIGAKHAAAQVQQGDAQASSSGQDKTQQQQQEYMHSEEDPHLYVASVRARSGALPMFV